MGENILSLFISSEVNPRIKEYIQNKMFEFNVMHFPDDLKGRYEELHLYLINEEGSTFGGIVGEFCWNWLEIQYLFIEQDLRNLGYGRQLLRAAEKKAMEKKCDFIKLDTLSFQALDFYLKEGFQIFGTIENAGSYTHYYLKKDICKK